MTDPEKPNTMTFDTLATTLHGHVAHIELNRPDKANAIDGAMWRDLRAAFEWLDESSARVAVLSGSGKHFTAGIDLGLLAALGPEVGSLPEGRREERLKEFITDLQDAIGAVESCRIPVIAAVHGACIGAGIDLITACDLRFSTEDATYSVKEVDLAIVADLGTLQRLPGIIGEGLARELAYTGRVFDGSEAQRMRLVNRVYPDKGTLLESVFETAAQIAAKSPLTIRGIKDTLNYSRDHSVAEGLEYVAAKNAATLFSPDLAEAMTAAREKRAPRFED